LLSSIITLFRARAWNPPAQANLGLIGPQFTVDGNIHTEGIHAISGALMALREINNKTDGIYDEILPNTVIKVALRTPYVDYIEATNAAIDLSSSVFNGDGIVGLVGASSSRTSKATAEIFSNTDRKIPQISYGAKSSDLGHSAQFKYSSRTCPSDADQGRILARIIRHYFNWNVVTIFTTGDTYGNDITLEFEDEAEKLNIDVERKVSFWSGITDFTRHIQSVQRRGGVLKIFVLLMKAHDAGRLLEQGYKLGLFKEGVQIFVTDYAATTDTWSVMSHETRVEDIMKGVIAVTPTLDYERASESGKQFISRYRAQSPTMYIDDNDGKRCDDTKDDDGHTYYFKGYAKGLTSSKLTCAGIDYPSLAEDGSDIQDSAFYAYDAMVAMARALHVVYYKKQVANMTGDDLKWAIIDDVQFQGAGSEVSFNRGGIGTDAYGQGDRWEGVHYEVLNFDPRQFHRYVRDGEEAWTVIGRWTHANQLILCEKYYDDQCARWVFNTDNGQPPVGEAPVLYVQMGNPSRIGLRFGGSISLALMVFLLLVVETCKETRLIKASQPTLMKIVLLGGFIACIRVIIATVDLNDNICIIGKWFGHLAFAFTFGALILKIWRVDAVINSGFKKVKVTNAQIQYVLAAGLFLFCVYLAVDTVYSRPHQSYSETFDGFQFIREVKCTNKDNTMTIALFALETAMLIAGARLCWTTKAAPGAVNESTYIAMSMYLILFVCAVLFPIVYLNIDPSPATLLMIMAVGFIIATIGCGLFLFGPKIVLLLEGADVNEKFEVVKFADTADLNESVNALQYVKKRIVSKLSDKSSQMNSRVSKQSLNAQESVHTAGTKMTSRKNYDERESKGGTSSRHPPVRQWDLGTSRTVHHSVDRIAEGKEENACRRETKQEVYYQNQEAVDQSGKTAQSSERSEREVRNPHHEDVRMFSTADSKVGDTPDPVL